MEIVYLLIAVVVAFILWTVVTTFRKMRATSHIASDLNPYAANEFIHWDTESNRAYAKGDARSAKVFRLKALVVRATESPLSDLAIVSGLPLICKPGRVESLSASELDEMLSYLETPEGTAQLKEQFMDALKSDSFWQEK